MAIEAPIRAEAELLHRPMTSGRNKALLLGCRTTAGAPVDCVVKLSACLGGTAPVPYLVEWCATVLGRLIGINVPEAVEVIITRDFAAVLPSPWRDLATSSLGSAFGSQFCPGFSQWSPGSLIPQDLRPAATELLAFDILIHNPDRRAENPNVLVSRQSLLAFDHGDAFSFVWPLLGAPDPADDPLLEVLEKHVFARGLGKKIPSLERFQRAVEDISDDQLAALRQATPSCWQEGLAAGKLDRILEIMRRRRDAISTWLPKVETWIQR